MWGVIPAAGRGSRIQPLAFSKELLPVGSQVCDGQERPKAVSEYLLDRMLLAGADKICFTISSLKSDILSYYGAGPGGARFFYTVQPRADGLCDAVFRAVPLIAPDEPVLIGLPDTIWFPEDGFRRLPDGELALLLFEVDRPELFDAVVTEGERVREIRVKSPQVVTRWIWGAIKASGRILAQLAALWERRGRRDEYLGTLMNAWMAEGGRVVGVRAGETYVDVGTVDGYRRALRLLRRRRDVPWAFESCR